MDLRDIGRSREHDLRGFCDLVLVAQNMRAREEVAWIVVRFLRQGIELLARILALRAERDAHFCDRNLD